MKKMNKSWMAVVAAAALLCMLVGVVWARPHERPGAADITRKVTLTGGDFIAAQPQNYDNSGLVVRCNSGSCFFTAPVVFPCLPSVTVERIKLHVEDSNGTSWGVAALYRANPPTQAGVWLGSASSPPGIGGFQTYTSPPINAVVWPSQRAYIYLAIQGTNIDVYGVTIEYHRNI